MTRADSLLRGAELPQYTTMSPRMDGIVHRRSVYVSSPGMTRTSSCGDMVRHTTAHPATVLLSTTRNGYAAQAMPRCMDGIRVQPVIPCVTPPDDAQSVVERCVDYCTSVLATYRAAVRISLSPQRMYQVSMAGAMIVGMASMSMIYRNLGSNAFADMPDRGITEVATASLDDVPTDAAVVPEETQPVKVIHNRSVPADDAPVAADQSLASHDSVTDTDTERQTNTDTEQKSVDSVKKADTLPDTPFTKEAKKMVKGYPIEQMLPYILEQDPEVAKYLIAIAKQESQWGKRVPKLDGKDCYNYWGYRGQRGRMGTGGHTCFDSPEDAVATVGKRLHTLIYDNNRTTAKKLVVWKCGSTCAGHDDAGVDRWIDVVSAYHGKLSHKS